jgi:hypothetical protein
MLNEQDQHAWADIERRLSPDLGSALDDASGSTGTPRFLTIQLTPIARTARSRWFPYVMAVVVPLLLPAISAAEMHPAVSSVGGLVLAVAVLRWAQREASGRQTGGTDPTPGQ